MISNAWRGVYSAMTTKLDAAEEVDLDAVRADVRFQIAGGVHGIVCCGSLGEASTLTADEKIAIAAAAKDEARGRVPVLLTIAEDSTRAAARLAERAAALDLDGLMVLPAMRYVSTPRETIAHFRAVAAASDLGIMVYNNPVAYAVDITPAMFAQIADEPKFVAIKESSGDVRRISDIINTVGEDRYAIFTGVDDLVLESSILGIDGWVAGAGIAFPEENQYLWELTRRGKWTEARAMYRWFTPLLHLDVHTKFVQYIKLAVQECGLGAEWVRPPRLPLNGEERKRILKVIHDGMERRPSVPGRKS